MLTTSFTWPDPDDPRSPAHSNSPSGKSAVASTAWLDGSTAMKDHDDAKIQGWKEEIDTHLVFVRFIIVSAICFR